MSKKKMGGGKKRGLSPQKRSTLQLTRLNSTLSSNKASNIDGALQKLDLDSYADYLFKVFLPNRTSVRFPSLNTRQKADFMKYLIVGLDVWKLITSDGSVDSEPAKWPGLATLKHAAQLDAILDQYYKVFQFEEGRRLFLVNLAQKLEESLVQTTIDPPPPVKGPEDSTEYDQWVSRERRLDAFIRSDLPVAFGQLILVNDNPEEYNGADRQTIISATQGLITQGVPGSPSPAPTEGTEVEDYPWPLYINIQIVDEILNTLRFMVLAHYRNKVGGSPYHTATGTLFVPYPTQKLQITSLFYHAAIPEELKTLFKPIADNNGIKLDFIYPETPEEMERFNQEYVIPSQAAYDGAAFMNEVLGDNTSTEVADRIMNVLLGSNVLTAETLETLSALGISDDDKIIGIANMVTDDDYSLFDKIAPGLGGQVKELVSPILDETMLDWTPKGFDRQNATEEPIQEAEDEVYVDDLE